MPNAKKREAKMTKEIIEQSKKMLDAKRFINIYVDNLVKQFRNYNNDKFTIHITGLACFVDKNNEIISYLHKLLIRFDFSIIVSGSAKRIDSIGVICTNETKQETYEYKYQIQNLPTIFELSSKTNIPTVGLIIMKIVAQTISKQKVLYKALVFDLDDTLWRGTLAEDGIKGIMKNMKSESGVPFIAFMNFIKVLANELGIFIAICSRNDTEHVKTAIEELDENTFPLKNQIDCLVANYNDKSDNLKEIAKQLSILPQAMIFIDDNQIIRDEVMEKLPEVFVPQWQNHSDLTTQLVAGCFFERNELSISSQERRRQLKILQAERKSNNLPELLIKVFDDENHREAMELYSKSNQFKLSKKNANFTKETQSLYFELFRKTGETLGICSAISFYKHNDECFIYNWAISCRYFEIGLEEFVILYILNKYVDMNICFACQHNNMNQKVHEWIGKYYGSIITDSCDSVPTDCDVFINHFDYVPPFKSLLSELINSKEQLNIYYIDNTFTTRELLRSHTNLKLIRNG